MIPYCQVNKTLIRRNLFIQFIRLLHNEPPKSVLYPLESRKLLKIRGNDAPIFLQGLITNDMRHFEEGAMSMYAMFLNNKGRVLYDTLIHKWEDNESFMIECDKEVFKVLYKHLTLYKLKRKVVLEDVSQDYRLWNLTVANDTPETNIDLKSSISLYKDPRVVDLGFRIISSINMDGSQIAQKFSHNIIVENDETGYKYLRYKLGVSEGAEDLPPGTTFPLEVNCDYLHGVSFHKGCYIGQELTARVYHTGVIRKRIMPLKFNEPLKENLEKDSIISASNKPKSNIGKLKGVLNEYGLGLIRIKEALDAKLVQIGNYTAEVVKPSWWPIEAPKEKVITKNDSNCN
ncbi:unnamed protein product [Diatraea saccharalis]|uniref:Transferase CAF17 homolog, mitochondrial n=1 Tax=Diatraea saccharalis TaxID=40085 RepID=A0A9N9WCJ4_9NEOP|nr:unnamed protein product [Diatraea saccharalis]